MAPPDPQPDRMRCALILAVIVAVGAALRLAGLTRESFWVDEGHSVIMASMPNRELIATAAGQVYPPFYFLFLKHYRPIAG